MKRVAILLLALAPFAAAANEAASSASAAGVRATRLANELRCLVCQNQSIAESNAELAVDLRRQIREQIAAGRSDGEIVDFMVSRYGDFVLYRPPFKAATLLLWIGPALLALAGFWTLARALRARRQGPAPPLTPEERERAGRLLAAKEEP